MAVMARHLEWNPNNKDVIKSVEQAYKYLQQRDLSQRYTGLYLWLMSASNSIVRNEKLPESLRKLAFDVSEKYHASMFKDNKLVFYYPNGNTCAHTEGLANYLLMHIYKDKYLNQNSREFQVYKDSVRENLKLLITKNNIDYLQSKNPKINKTYALNKLALGGFIDHIGKGGTRIDYTQHCIRALMPYQDIIDGFKEH